MSYKKLLYMWDNKDDRCLSVRPEKLKSPSSKMKSYKQTRKKITHVRSNFFVAQDNYSRLHERRHAHTKRSFRMTFSCGSARSSDRRGEFCNVYCINDSQVGEMRRILTTQIYFGAYFRIFYFFSFESSFAFSKNLLNALFMSFMNKRVLV